MAFFSNYKKISVGVSSRTAAQTATFNGTGIDLRTYEAALLILDVGALGNADNTGTFEWQESDDNVSFSAIATANLDGGALPALSSASDLTTYVRGYKGTKRFVRLALTALAGTTKSVNCAGYVARSRATDEPVTQG